MMRLKTLFACLLAALAFSLAACGDESEPVEPVAWPFLETTQKLSINGKEFNAYIATNEIHRRRALNGLAIKDGQAIAYLYPAQKEAVELRFINLPDPVDLVFVDGAGKVIQVDNVPAFSQSTFPRAYAAKDVRVVLQVRGGVAKDLGVSKGSEVKTDPNLLDQSKEAGATFATMFFLRNEKPEDKPESAPSVQLKVLEKAEDVAQLVKDRDDLKEGQGVLVPINSQYHEFWLKEAKGKWCACYLESSGRFRATVISALYEGIETNGGSDLDEPVYYSPTEATHLAIWKGSDFFAANKIERRSQVTIAGLDAMSSDEPEYDKLEIKFGDTRLEAELARTDDEREAALLKARTLEAGKAIVLAWDDPAQVKINDASGANLWFVSAASGKYSISQDQKVGSRFVLAVPADFKPTGELVFPYVLRDLKPFAPPLIFYKAKQKDVVTDRWPGKADSFKARTRMELAITDAEQTLGLMYRTSLRENYGMLFIYKEEEPDLQYWMKNCKMNLSIAFCDAKGVIIKIHQVMKAPDPGTPDRDLERYESGGAAKYAVELEEKWYEKNKVEVGDRIFIPPELANME
jgi:uncharacterized membrane protein (UPF0127 family)